MGTMIVEEVNMIGSYLLCYLVPTEKGNSCVAVICSILFIIKGNCKCF